jgi:hypothetical protein
VKRSGRDAPMWVVKKKKKKGKRRNKNEQKHKNKNEEMWLLKMYGSFVLREVLWVTQ